jgi:dihydroorotase
MRIQIRNGRIVDPATQRDGKADLFVAEGKIVEEFSRPDRVIDATGLVVAPGFIDLAARLREPGLEYKATLESEMQAAVAGGVTSLACPPDTDPPLDEPGLVDMLRRRAQALSQARLYPVGALTVKLQGEALTQMGELSDAGCIAFSQGNALVLDTQVLWRALQYAATFGFKVWLRAEDAALAKGGVAHDGEVATRLGLPGIPSFAETIALSTLLELARGCMCAGSPPQARSSSCAAQRRKSCRSRAMSGCITCISRTWISATSTRIADWIRRCAASATGTRLPAALPKA